MKQAILHKYFASILIIFLLLGCSVEKNTFVNRQFHNMTAHYNVYFNGHEAMKAGLMSIDEQIEEDFSKVLPIFKESLPETEMMVTSDMNTAIDKATKLIRFHSITNPPESSRKQNARKRKAPKPEYNKWVDDAFIMMGRAYLYQKNYIMAASTFTQVIRKYKDNEVKFLAYIWLLRTYNEAERYAEAEELIESLEGNDQFPEDLEGELAINTADFHLKQQHHDEAIQYLNIGIKKIKGNKRKSRYAFILGQLYQETGKREKALEAYQQVIRRRPDYKMMFNARIKSAEAFSGEGDVASLRKELLRMSKKLKNEPFLDQIYFALGNIAYNEGQLDKAMDYYRKSAAMSVDNTYQRALSCLTLADIYFEEKDYVPAGQYYDSAMVVIDENYPNYRQIAQQYTSLNSLVKNLLTVETQDSLQYLAGLSAEELDQKIQQWIAVEQERMARMEEEMASGDMGEGGYGRSMSSRMRISGGGGWYFYNPSTVSYGKKEFQRLWGERKNEDNWRRSDKSEVLYDEFGEPLDEEMDALIEEEEKRADDPTTPEYYKQDIPTTDSLMDVSNRLIRDALYNAGNIFQSEFNDYERAIQSFNTLNKRFPENKYELPSYYHLWDLHKSVAQADSAQFYKELILDNYPESNYAKYLINPNYFIEEEARKEEINNAYQQAFLHYKNRKFEQALQSGREVMRMNPDTTLIPKVRFINVISGSRNLPKKQFADSLKIYLRDYPAAEPSSLAQQILALIEDEKLEDYDKLVNTGYLNEVIKNLELLEQGQEQANPEIAKWEGDEELLHYFVIALPNNEDIDINRLRFDIANYNIDYYTTLDFDIEIETLNTETKLILVRNFIDKETAMVYFHSIIRKPEVFQTLAGIEFINFVISNINFREMLTDRQYEDYLKFFVKNYSIYTTSFPEEELESPEELMARLNRDEEELVEQGEFVELEIDDSQYQTPTPEEMIYLPYYGDAHHFMVLIREPRYRTGFLMRDFVRYNAGNYRNERLRVIPTNLENSTLLLVSNFDNGYKANEYLEAAKDNESLFETLSDVTYELYVIGDENLKQLRATNDLEKWAAFYKRYYVYQKPPSPETEEETAPSGSLNQPDTDNNAQSDDVPPEPNVNQEEAKEESNLPVQSTEETNEQEEVEPAAGNENEQSEPTPVAQEEKSQPEGPTEVVAEVPAKALLNDAFKQQDDAVQNLIFLLPSDGSNQRLLLTYLNRLNAINYRSTKVQVRVDEFDDFRSLVVVSGLANKEMAQQYLSDVEKDNRISMSLRNVNYKKYLISNENLDTFKENKDIQGYQAFYDSNY